MRSIRGLPTLPIHSLKHVQYNLDVMNVNIVNNLGLVNPLLFPILLLLWSKITVDIVNNLDLVNKILLTKKFTKSRLRCILVQFEGSY